MSGDDWYFALNEAGNAQAADSAAQSEVDARDRLKQAGAGRDERLDDFDLVAMNEDQMPMDGTLANGYAQPFRKVVGRRDASTGEVLAAPSTEDPVLFPPPTDATPSDLSIVAQGAAGAAQTVATTAARGVYKAGAGVWNFAADVYEWLGGDPAQSYRPPTAEEIGIPAPTNAWDAAATELVRFGTGFAAASSRLQGLASAPRTALGRVTATPMRAAAAGAVTEFVVGDPRYDSTYDALVSLFSAEQELAGQFSIASMAQTPGGAMAGRAALVAEGAVLGAMVGAGGQVLRAGGEKAQEAARALWLRADEIEQTAVEAMRKNRYTFQSGLDPADVGWLGTWMAARIAKGAKTLTDSMSNAVADVGATRDQIVEAYNAAAGMSQKARAEALKGWMQRAPAQAHRATAKMKLETGGKLAPQEAAALVEAAPEPLARSPVAAETPVTNLRRKTNLDEGQGEPLNAGRKIKTPEGLVNLGRPTTEEWVNRVEANLSPDEIVAAREWYSEVQGLFGEWFGKDGNRYMAAWLMSNQNVTPPQALMNALRVSEQVKSGATGKEGGLSDAAVRELFGGGTPSKGMGPKLHDFIDSGLGKTTRTWTGDAPEGGAPAVVDIWTSRDMGYVDWPHYRRLVERYGQKAVDKAGVELDTKIDYSPSPEQKKAGNKSISAVLDAAGITNDGSTVTIGGRETPVAYEKAAERGLLQRSGAGVSEVQYERAAGHVRDLTEQLNAMTWRGSNRPYTPAEIQAIGWMAMGKAEGQSMFDTLASIKRNIRSVASGVDPAALSAVVPGFETLPVVKQSEVIQAYANSAIDTALDIVKPVETMRIFGPSGVRTAKGQPVGSVDALVTKEGADDMAAVLAEITGQPTRWMTPQPKGKVKALDLQAPELQNPAMVDQLREHIEKTNPKLWAKLGSVQFAPTESGVRITRYKGGVTEERMLADVSDAWDDLASTSGYSPSDSAILNLEVGKEQTNAGKALSRYGPGIQGRLLSGRDAAIQAAREAAGKTP